MVFFSKKVLLEDSGIFSGFTDWHSHILPGVDDGIKTIEESLATLEEFEKLGIRKVWLTPHIMEDYPNETDALREKFEELKNQWQGNIELRLASENMLDSLFEERLEANDFLPIGEEGDHLLVETSYFTPPFGIEEMLEGARKRGYNLILAHPERYQYMNEEDYKNLQDKGIKFQTNLFALIGVYGDSVRKKAEWLVKQGYVNYLGSDLHRRAMLGFINKDGIKAKTLEGLKASLSAQ